MTNGGVDTVDSAHGASEQHLSTLVYQWRGASSRNDRATAEDLVRQYQQIAEDMHQRGWDGGWLPPDAMLPDDLMPNFLKEG